MTTRSVNDIPNAPVKNAFLDTSSSGSNEVVAAVPGKSINVLSVSVITKVANDVKFLSGATQISATMPLATNGGYVLAHNPYGWFNTAVGEALNISSATASMLGVIVNYIEV